MDFNKYKSGPGLDLIALQQLKKILDLFENNVNILEFGSGFSTSFLIDYKFFSGKNIFIDSYDNDPNWCFQNTENYTFLNLNVKPLISCSDKDYNYQLENKKYNKNRFKTHISLPYNHPKYWRQRNCFYDVNNNDLKDNYDIVIIDGPNGNGRNIAYLHIKEKVKSGSYILIDDHNSKDDEYDYNFIGNLKNIINVEKIFECNNIVNPCWENGNNFCIFKVV